MGVVGTVVRNSLYGTLVKVADDSMEHDMSYRGYF